MQTSQLDLDKADCILEQNLQNHEFKAERTVGFEELKSSVAELNLAEVQRITAEL